jgi:hypothetical protein
MTNGNYWKFKFLCPQIKVLLAHSQAHQVYIMCGCSQTLRPQLNSEHSGEGEAKAITMQPSERFADLWSRTQKASIDTVE